MMRVTLRLLVVASLFVPAAASAAWHIGPNFGLAHIAPVGGESSTFVDFGAGAGPVFAMWEPGMRIGTTIAHGQDELYAATGVELLSLSGSSAHMFQLSANYQHDFTAPSTDGPYATVGLGFLSIGGEHSSATVPVIGGGFGFHHFFLERHARFRGEVRYDRQGEDSSFGLAAANVIALRLGFDLMNP